MEKVNINIQEQANEILRIAQKFGVEQNFLFLTTFKRYQVQLSILNELEQRIKNMLKSALGLAATIKLVAPNTLKRFEGKAKRVTDLRKDGL